MALQDLTKPLTPDEVKTAIYSALSTSGVNATSWKPGAVARTLIAVFAVVLAAFSELVALIARSGFLELSSGGWLDLVAWYVYGVERNPESFATGFVTFTNAGASSFVAVQPGDLIVRNAVTGCTYRNTAAFTSLPSPAPESSIQIPIQADLVGTAGDAGIGEISEFVTTFVGCTVENEAALVGSDREEDIPLRARARSKTGVLSPNGPRDAYTFLATSAKRADGSSIGIQRVRCIPVGDGAINIYLADEDGTVTGTVGDESTDLGIVNRDIQEQAAPLAINAIVQAATPLDVNLSFELFLSDTIGLTASEIQEAIDDQLIDFFARVPIGGMANTTTGDGFVNRAAIQAAIVGTKVVVEDSTRTLAEFCSNFLWTLPAADVAVADDEAPILGTLNAVITLVPNGPLV